MSLGCPGNAMDAWMDGWMEVRMDGSKDGWMDGWTPEGANQSLIV